MSPILIPVLVLSGIGLVLAGLLALGRKAFYVEVDIRQEKLMDILPGANCGGCGFPGCSGYASALVSGSAAPTLCPPGGSELAGEIGKLLGIEVGDVQKQIACVACAGDSVNAVDRVLYSGVQDCLAAHLLAGGPKSCTFGCLGLGSCKEVCPFDAVIISNKGIAYIDPIKCTGCGKCIEACPRNLISLVPADAPVHVLCKNPNKAKHIKAVCQVGCTGCKACNKRSKQFEMTGALAMVNHSVDEKAAEEIAFLCPQGSIFDSRRYTLAEWIERPETRRDYESKREAWKAGEKAKRAAAKEKKKSLKDKKSSDTGDNATGKAAKAKAPASEPSGGDQ